MSNVPNQKILESIVTMMPYVTVMYESMTLIKEDPHLMDKISRNVDGYVEELCDY